MPNLFELLKKPVVQIGILVFLLVFVSAAIFGLYLTQVPPEQPIAFPHDIHVNQQIQCLYCHPGAWKQASSGLPTTNKCWACHGQLKKYYDPPVEVSQWPTELQKLYDYVNTGTPIQWVPVYQVPDFVHFNHRPHVASGLNCEDCHGDMSTKTVATLEQTINMGWCINCHQDSTADNPVKQAKLLDCGTCHY